MSPFSLRRRWRQLCCRVDRERMAELQATLGLPGGVGSGKVSGLCRVHARPRRLLTYAQRDDHEKTLNPSPFITDLRQLFPCLR
jgi:hypothetical protein